jgi:flotillin
VLASLRVEAVEAGGESYFRCRQIEMIPQIAPMIAEPVAKARLVTISGHSAEGGSAQSATSNITSVIQTVAPPAKTGSR